MDRQIAFNPDKIQNSQGVLKHSQINQFISSKQIIAELDIQKIHPFQLVPDYTLPTKSPHPIVVISPTSCSCIDGWDLIQKAKTTDNTKIDCYAFYIPDHNQTEIAIQKVAIRTMPQGGTCSYSELVRNARILFYMLMDSADNPVVFSHGGARRGVNYTNNKEENIRELLAERLGKSKTTINKYLSHGEYLIDYSLNTLIESNEGKAFFEEAQKNKRILIKDLLSEGESEEIIAETVSQNVLSWLEEFHETGKIGTILTSAADDQDDENQNSEFENKISCSLKQAEYFKYPSGNLGNSIVQKKPTDETARAKLSLIKQQLITLDELNENHENIVTVLKAVVEESLLLISDLEFLNAHSIKENKEEL
jgi:hypothetical protein